MHIAICVWRIEAGFWLHSGLGLRVVGGDMAHLGRHFRLLSRRLTIQLSSPASSRSALDGGCWRSDDVMMVSMRGLSTASIRDGVVLPFEACGGDKEWSSRKGLDSKATPGLPTWMESRKFATVASSFVGELAISPRPLATHWRFQHAKLMIQMGVCVQLFLIHSYE